MNYNCVPYFNLRYIFNEFVIELTLSMTKNKGVKFSLKFKNF